MNQEDDPENNIANYVVPEDDVLENEYINMINVFMFHFKRLFNKNNNYNMLNDIDQTQKNSTNRCMEYVFEEMFKFKEETDEKKKKLYKVGRLDINNCTELYSLTIDDNPICICQYLLPLIQKVSTLDWTEIHWSIIPIKTNN